jgi:hypothetical protein
LGLIALLQLYLLATVVDLGRPLRYIKLFDSPENMAAINRSIEVCQVMERGNNSNRSMEVVQVIENRNRYVTKEEFENLASRIEENEEKRMFEKKVEEKKMLERFNDLNDRIMIVDTKGKFKIV